MRAYEIHITNADGSPVVVDGKQMSFVSHRNGLPIPGALNIEMDISVVTEEIAVGNALVRIWGVGLGLLNKAANLNMKNITILAGMLPGLPLATKQANAIPARNGILFQGSIFQAFGNWQGGEQTLDFIITTQLVSRETQAPELAKKIVFDCPAGGGFASAIRAAMANSGVLATVQVSERLVAPEPIQFYASSITRFAMAIEEHSKRIINDPEYLGVKVVKIVGGYLITDNSTKGAAINIDFTDLIGQPTWLDFSTVQMKCVMRSDIKVANTVILPKANLLNTAKAFSNLKDEIAYAGTAWVKSVRHIGNFRQADANSWVTILDVLLNQK